VEINRATLTLGLLTKLTDSVFTSLRWQHKVCIKLKKTFTEIELYRLFIEEMLYFCLGLIIGPPETI
jgi:hypothetical protein